MTFTLDNTIWLALRQMRDIWTSFVFSAVYFAFLGAVLAGSKDGVSDVAFTLVILILIEPVLSNRYMTWKKDNEVLRHQTFLRGLPIDSRTVVVARLISMLVSGAINVPLFFVWYWVLSDSWNSFATFFSWCVFWFGISLIGCGFSLVMEFGVSLRRWIMINLVVIAVLIAAIVIQWLVSGHELVGASQALAQNHPGFAALIGIAIGVGALIAGPALAVRVLRRREFVQ